MVRRLWGQDEVFMARHGARYHRAIADARLKRARWLIKEGRTDEARADLRAIGGGPLHYRLLAAVPGRIVPVGLLHGLSGLRHALK